MSEGLYGQLGTEKGIDKCDFLLSALDLIY